MAISHRKSGLRRYLTFSLFSVDSVNCNNRLSFYYFIHSYEAKPAAEEYRLADTVYGGRKVCAAAQKGCVIGTQFHPEKSGPVGLGIIKAYLDLCAQAE